MHAVWRRMSIRKRHPARICPGGMPFLMYILKVQLISLRDADDVRDAAHGPDARCSLPASG